MKTLLILLMAIQPKPKDTLWRVHAILGYNCPCVGYSLMYEGKAAYLQLEYWGEAQSKKVPNIKAGDSILMRRNKVYFKGKRIELPAKFENL